MEPILPEFPWNPSQGISALPEAQLIHAIILLAWSDSNKKINCPTRNEARNWFFSDQFMEFCELLDLPVEAIQESLLKSWN